MNKHTSDENFRYGNDNRDLDGVNNPELFDFGLPSQNMPPLGIKKGFLGYYPNDNGGYYANSNRPDTSFVDEKNKIQPPNSNFKIT